MHDVPGDQHQPGSRMPQNSRVSDYKMRWEAKHLDILEETIADNERAREDRNREAIRSYSPPAARPEAPAAAMRALISEGFNAVGDAVSKYFDKRRSSPWG